MNQFKQYIGVKVIQAYPEEREGKPGYLVQYEGGFKSWSPKETFEEAYVLIGHDNTPRGVVEELLPDIKILSLAAAHSVAKQLLLGAAKGYTDWINCAALYLVMKAVKALGTGNWRSAITFAAMLHIKEPENKAANKL